ncbi:MAG: NUDIX hydrolase [Candidatus Ancillula sp.]|jgi:8-oxo-dGTP diphosphatase|nr:NUDIX hydrolase [Candidatus Ancillula sp.]
MKKEVNEVVVKEQDPKEHSKKERAAGGVVFKIEDDKVKVLLVHRPRYLDWSFPKGKIEPGEHPAIAAIREIEEEAGEKVVLQKVIKELEYPIENNIDVKHVSKYDLPTYNKKVRYYSAFLANPKGKYLKVRFPVSPASEKEIDDVKWVTLENALEMLTYRNDKVMLKDFCETHSDLKQFFTGIMLEIEPCEAILKKSWAGDKNERPLSSQGIAAAADLAHYLSAFGIDTLVVESKKLFKRQTVNYYSYKTGYKILDKEPDLSKKENQKLRIAKVIKPFRIVDESINNDKTNDKTNNKMNDKICKIEKKTKNKESEEL